MEPDHYKDNKRTSLTRTKDVERGKSVNNIVTKAEHDNQTYAFIVSNNKRNIQVRMNKGNIQDLYNVWLFDSSASNHMVNDLKWFINIKFQDGHLYQAGENSKLRYESTGTIKFRVYWEAVRKV